MIPQTKFRIQYRREIIFLTIRFVLLLLISGFLMVYFYSGISDYSKNLVEKRNSLFAFQQRLESAGALKQRAQEAEANLVKLESSLPTRDNVLPILVALENIAASTGVESVPVFEGESSLGSGGLESVGCKLTVRGKYSSIVSYLEKVEKSPYLINFNSFVIHSSQGLENPCEMTAQGEIFVFSK